MTILCIRSFLTAVVLLVAKAPSVFGFLRRGVPPQINKNVVGISQYSEHTCPSNPFIIVNRGRQVPYRSCTVMNSQLFDDIEDRLNNLFNLFNPPKPAEINEKTRSLRASQTEMSKLLEAADQALGDADALLSSTGSDSEGLGKRANRATTVEDAKNWSSCNVGQLKVELKNRGLPVSGKKTDLIQRLIENDNTTTSSVVSGAVAVVEDTSIETDWESMTVPQLKVQLRSQGLSVAGKKSDLISRLVNPDSINSITSDESKANDTGNEKVEPKDSKVSSTSDLESVLSGLTTAQLKSELRNHGLSVAGKKADLISRLAAENLQKEAELSDKVADVNSSEKKKTDNHEASPTFEEMDLSNLTVAQLKSKLKTHGLSVSGKKADLIFRLAEAQNNNDKVESKSATSSNANAPKTGVPLEEGKSVEQNWSNLTVAELKVELKNLGLPVTGKKAELVSRLAASQPRL